MKASKCGPHHRPHGVLPRRCHPSLVQSRLLRPERIRTLLELTQTHSEAAGLATGLWSATKAAFSPPHHVDPRQHRGWTLSDDPLAMSSGRNILAVSAPWSPSTLAPASSLSFPPHYSTPSNPTSCPAGPGEEETGSSG